MRCLSLGILEQPQRTQCNLETLAYSTEHILTLTYPAFHNVSLTCPWKRSVLTEFHDAL